MEKISTLIYFISGKGSSHEVTEVKCLSSKFDKLIFISTSEIQKNIYPHDAKIQYITLPDFKKYNKKQILLTAFKLIPIWVRDTFRGIFNLTYLKQSKTRLHILAIQKLKADYLFPKLNISKDSYFGSYWFNEATLILTFLKKNGKINSFFTRTHGRDLYEFREPLTGIIPYRKFVLNHIDKVFCISQNGKKYLSAKYPKFKIKFEVSYLGTDTPLKKDQNKQTSIFTIVSCARYKNIKRLFLIAELLYEIQYPIKWIHIGQLNDDDPTFPRFQKALKKLKQNKFVQYNLLGQMTNKQIHQFYASNPINLFVSLSETEGLPVSFMEAISYGIPILSTNVGGCSELATEKTGFLIPKNFKKEDFLLSISRLKNNSNLFNSKEIESFWDSNFSTKNNYQKFFLKIKKL